MGFDAARELIRFLFSGEEGPGGPAPNRPLWSIPVFVVGAENSVKNLFRAVAIAAVTAAAVVAVPVSSVAEAPATVTAAGMERLAISGPGYTPPPAPDLAGRQAEGQWHGPYTYRNARANKCLDILGASLERLAPAVQYTCVAGGRSQMWWDYIFEMDGFFYNRLIGNNYSGMCLHVDGKNIPIKQIGCAMLTNQMFETVSPNLHLVQNENLCMEIQGASPDNFARIVTWDCHGRSHQLWYFYDA